MTVLYPHDQESMDLTLQHLERFIIPPLRSESSSEGQTDRHLLRGELYHHVVSFDTTIYFMHTVITLSQL